MKKLLKKSLSVLLAITIILSSAIVGLSEVDLGGLFAVNPFKDLIVKSKAASEEALTFTLSSDGTYYSVTDCNTSYWCVVIPETYNDLPVTHIASYAFQDCNGLESIEIPASITSIGAYAFDGCYRVSTVKIKDLSVWCKIDFGNAYSNPLYNNSSSYYSSNLYLNDTKITALVIPDGVTKILAYSFAGASFTSVTIPDSVISIGEGAFYKCKKIESITLPFIGSSRTNNKSYSAVFGYLFGYETYSGSSTIYQYTQSNSTKYTDYYYYIPSSLKSVTITDTTRIPYHAFYNCSNLTSITIPDTVTNVDNYAFSGCTGLKSVYINDVAGWCNISFSGSEANPLSYAKNLYVNDVLVKDIIIPNGVTSIPDYGFSCENITSVTIPESVTSIGNYAFKNCTGLEKVYWNAKNTADFTSSSNVFYNAGTASTGIELVFGDGVERIPAYLCYAGSYSANISSITIPESVTYIGVNAFTDTSYFNNKANWENNFLYIGEFLVATDASGVSGSYTVKEGTKAIAPRAFTGCTNLTSITVPNSVKNIGDYAFSDCTNLSSITLPDLVLIIGTDAFKNTKYINNIVNNKDGFIYIGNHLIATSTGVEIKDDAGNSYIVGALAPECHVKDGTLDIAPGAFAGNTQLEQITIPDSVKILGDTAFKGCSNLTAISLSKNVTSIGADTFYNCSSLSFIEIPDCVTSIGKRAFYGCESLTTVTIPVGVTYVGCEAFYNCVELTSVYWNAKSVPDFQQDSNVFYEAGASSVGIRLVFGDTVETIPAYICSGYGNMLASYYRPSEWESPNVTSITIGKNVKRIGYDAFRERAFWSSAGALKSVYITDVAAWCNIEFVNSLSNPLYYAEKLYINGELAKHVVIPKGVTKIPLYGFSCENITSVTVSEGVTSIDIYSFYNCANLKSITLPNSVTNIDGSAFYGCSGLTNITIPDSVTSIGPWAFYYCTSLLNINIPEKVMVIGDGAFYGCTALECVNWDAKNVRDFSQKNSNVICSGVFAGAGTSGTGMEFVFGNTVERIPAYLFYTYSDAPKVVSVRISDSIESIGLSAFTDCTSLESVYINDIAGWCNISFSSGTSNPLTYAKNLYVNDVLVKDIIIPNGVTQIPICGFSCENIESITLPDSLSTIGNSAFSNCKKLDNIKIPDGVTEIPYAAFYGCTNLKSITLPSGLTTISEYVFGDCKNITSVTIPEGVTEIPHSAFYGCTNLKSITLPSGLTTIGSWAFAYCDSLTSVTIPDSVTNIGSCAFYDCDGITSIKIPDGVKQIDSNTFCSCTGLVEIYIPDSVTSIGAYAFENCINLGPIYVPDSVTSLGNYAFYGCSDVVIPKSVNSIAKYTFGDTSNIYYAGTSEEWTKLCSSVTINQDTVVHYNTTTAHNEETILKEPTCTDVGIKIVSCECGYSKNVAIPIVEHSYGEWVVTTQPTCTETGRQTKTCVNCGATSTEEISALGHDYSTEWTIDVAATCTTNGSKSHHCSRCDSKTDDTVIEAAGHSYGEWIITTQPTCTEFGSAKKDCVVCSYSLQSGKTLVDSSLYPESNHNYSNNTSKTYNFSYEGANSLVLTFSASTNTESGYDYIYIYTATGSIYGRYTGTSLAGKTITLIGDSFKIKLTSDSSTTKYGFSFTSIIAVVDENLDIVKPIGHDYSAEWTIDVPSTCTTDGSKSHHCLRCDGRVDETVIVATGHTEVIDAEIDSTCTETGLTAGTHCSVCNTVIVSQTTIPATGHTASNWIFDNFATCTEDGSKHKECTVCNVILEDEIIPATGHFLSNWIIDVTATVNTAGSQHKECTECGEILETEVIPQLKPATPKLAKIANTASGVQVTWGKVSGADSYIVYRKTYNAKTKAWSGWSKLKEGVTSTSFVDKTAKSGTYYLYTVRATNEGGTGGYNTTGIKTYFLSTPKLTSTANTNSAITVKWGKVTGANGYYVYRKTGNNGWTKIATVKGNGTVSYTDKTAKSGVTYKYTIRAYYGSYLSSYNANGLAVRRLTTPSLKSVTSAKAGVTFKWSKVTGATGYTVYRKTGNGGWQKLATVTGNGKVSCLDKTAKKGITYKYTVRAYYGSSTSAYNTKGLAIKDKY